MTIVKLNFFFLSSLSYDSFMSAIDNFSKMGWQKPVKWESLVVFDIVHLSLSASNDSHGKAAR